MLYTLVILIFISSGAFSLKLREVSVPSAVVRGQAVRLGCYFDLEGGDKLYSVKWHKDSVEFYRYLPDNWPHARKYILEGTTFLDLNKSSKDSVYMSRTDVHSEGLYRCEVSTDAPSFQTVKGEGEMRIYVFPSERPRILGVKESYAVNEQVRVTCIAAPSRPATFLSWFINGLEVPTNDIVRRDTEYTDDGLLISSLGLRFRVKDYHFVDEATMTLHCEAIISQAHTLTSAEMLIYQNFSSVIDRPFDHTSSGKGSLYSRFERGPFITGGHRLNYRVDDEVDINCTAPGSQPPAELHWYMNDKEVKSNHIVKYPSIPQAGGQESSVLGLRFIIKQRYFLNGQPMRLRCTAAALSEATKMSSPIVQVLNRNQRQQVSGLHVLEKTLAVSDSSCQRILAEIFTWILLTVTLVTTHAL